MTGDKGCGQHCGPDPTGKWMIHCYGDCCHGRPETGGK
jgi:hypothetical protein